MTGEAPPLWKTLWSSPRWLAFVVAALVLPVWMLLRPAAPELPHMGRLPAFALQDQLGRPVDRESLAGQVVVLDFIFTRCPDVCPVLSRKMADLREELPPEPLLGKPITFVSLSVDPDHDTPEVLAEYGQRYGADPASWRFLTGDRQTVMAIADGLIQGLTLGPEGRPAEVNDITHGERFVLIDSEGSMRGAFVTDPEGLAAVARGARQLSRE